ncbi:MAG: hypothetical protein NTZ56_06660 [Acidobacteria bacterium]|nr:hypothetical protein [Acidobacteriota bacterium]
MSDEVKSETPAEAKPTGNKDEVALEMMKFIAVTTGYGKGSAGAGFEKGRTSRTAEEYAESLLELFERCRTVVHKPVS